MSADQQDLSLKIRSECFHDFVEALEALYIPGNLSGRIHFRQDWPAAATFIFPADLIKSDEEGGLDKSARAALEQQADEERLRLLSVLYEFDQRFIESGVAHTAAIQEFIDATGQELARYIYAQDVVEKLASVLGSALSVDTNAPRLLNLKLFVPPKKGLTYAELLTMVEEAGRRRVEDQEAPDVPDIGIGTALDEDTDFLKGD